MNTKTSNERLGDLVSGVKTGTVIPRPAFQRRSTVWTNKDKEYLIDSVLKAFPFPEIFLCEGEKIEGGPARKKWVVDGQQRVTTLAEYRFGTGGILYNTVDRFVDLSPEAQDEFDKYSVAVRQLGPITGVDISEVFRRINATDYQLKAMERLNAIYSGEFRAFCLKLADHKFFKDHSVFREGDLRRMNDLTYCVTLVATILGGYFRRTEDNEKYLSMYNEEFMEGPAVMAGVEKCFDYLERCGFSPKSRAWNQVDLFTLLVESYHLLVEMQATADPQRVGVALTSFFDRVDALFKAKADVDAPASDDPQTKKYYKAAAKAPGDKFSRIARSEVIETILANSTSAKKPRQRKASKD